MKLFKQLLNTTPKIFPQGKNGRNSAAIKGLLELGFSMPEIRIALVRLNGLDVSKLANGVSTSTLYNTLKGIRSNEVAQEKLAEAFRLKREELFPELREGS